MLIRSDIFMTVQAFLLLGFLGVTSLLMLVSVTNRLRLRRVLCAWRSGPLFGLPLLPLAFCGVVLAFSGYSFFAEQGMHLTLLAGYLLGGIFWLTAALLASTHLITEYGMILNANRVDRSIAWGQVVDYFEQAQGTGHHFVFFYLDGGGLRHRFELHVPAAHLDRFRDTVRAKLDARFEFTAQQLYGKKALEG